MTEERRKPFTYDAIETDDYVVLIIDYQGADGRPATADLQSTGLSVERADGKVIRFGNLHRHLHDQLATKPIYIAEFTNKRVVIYATRAEPLPFRTAADIFQRHFYWYFGPETATLTELAARPAARLAQAFGLHAMSVAPGEPKHGSLIGLVQCHNVMVVLTRNRAWAQARAGLIVDAGLISATTSGLRLGENVSSTVIRAHTDETIVFTERLRTPWRSHIACVVRKEDLAITTGTIMVATS